jgi:hypothetical protein
MQELIYNLYNYDIHVINSKKLYIAVNGNKCYILKKFIKDNYLIDVDEKDEIIFFDVYDGNNPIIGVDYLHCKSKKDLYSSISLPDYVEISFTQFCNIVSKHILKLTFNFVYRNDTIMDYCCNLPTHIEILNITFVVDRKYILHPSLDNLPITIKYINVINTVYLITTLFDQVKIELYLFNFCKAKKYLYHDKIYPVKHKLKLPFDCKISFKNTVYENINKFDPYIYEDSEGCTIF